MTATVTEDLWPKAIYGTDDDEACRHMHPRWAGRADRQNTSGKIGLVSRLNATLSVDGVECTYSGQLSDFYTGTMSCPGREEVPLKLWAQ